MLAIEKMVMRALFLKRDRKIGVTFDSHQLAI